MQARIKTVGLHARDMRNLLRRRRNFPSRKNLICNELLQVCGGGKVCERAWPDEARYATSLHDNCSSSSNVRFFFHARSATLFTGEEDAILKVDN